MTALDQVLDDLGAEIAALETSGRVVLYRACGRALRPLYEQWARVTGQPDASSSLDRVDALCEESLLLGYSAPGAASLLSELEVAMPPGDAIGDVSSTGAQACWIAYDTSLRVLVESAFRADLCVEYMLQPLLASVSERLFGFSQVGSGPHEEVQLEELVAEPRTQEAVRWIQSACLIARSDDLLPLHGRHHPLLP